MSHDGMKDAQEADQGLPPSIPPMPTVSPSQLYRGSPRLLRKSGLQHSLGWQVHRTAGPTFVVVRLTPLDGVKVTSRFPLSAQGWESAWRTLSDLDARAATEIRAILAATEERRLAALGTHPVPSLRHMTYDGGSGDASLTQGQAYDLCFLDDRLTVRLTGSTAAVAEFPYHDLDAVEISGSDRSKSTGETAAVISAVALVGAILGLVILGLLGFFLGALLFGLIAALVAALTTKIKTILRLRGRDAEFFFSTSEKTPDAMRIELSGPLMAIAGARTAQQPGSGELAAQDSTSIPDQLSKLASLLADGVLSREEFEHIKAKVIAQS